MTHVNSHGSTSHPRVECRYREFNCDFCKRASHLELVCRQKNNDKPTVSPIRVIYQLRKVNQRAKSINRSTHLSLRINDQDCALELDTVADHTILNVTASKKLRSPSLQRSALQSQCYSGQPLIVRSGYDRLARSTFPLLSLQWMKTMKMDLNLLIHEPNNIQRPTGKSTID